MAHITSDGGGQGHEPCPRAGCGGTLCNYRRAIGTSGPMKGEWIVGLCSNDCGAFSLDLAPSKPPQPRAVERTVVEWSGDLSDIRAVPSSYYAPALTGREIERGNMLLCPFHDDHTPSLHVRDDDAGWCCHGCDESGGLPEFYCRLQNRSVPTDRREFKRLIYEIVDALRTAG